MAKTTVPDPAQTLARIEALVRKAKSTRPDRNVAIQRQITTLAAASYGLPVSQVLRTMNRGPYAEARVLIILLLDRHLKMPPAQICRLFNGNFGVDIVRKRLRAFARAEAGDRSQKIYGDEQFIAKFASLNKAITDFIAATSND